MSTEKDLKCSVSEARNFCSRTIEHISDLCKDSLRILVNMKADDDIGRLRGSYILTLLALEETGKLFQVWQAAASAEKQAADEIIVNRLFADHDMKSATAGDLCCQMLDYVARVTEPDESAREAAANQFSISAIEAGKHLKSLYLDYSRIREATMYIANDEGESWRGMSREVMRNIMTETLLLHTVAEGARMYLESGGDFAVAVKALADIKSDARSPEYYEFAGRMTEGMLKKLQEPPGS